MGDPDNFDDCAMCGDGGSLLCCSFCLASFHLTCVTPRLKLVPEGDWKCPICVAFAISGRKKRKLSPDDLKGSLEQQEKKKRVLEMKTIGDWKYELRTASRKLRVERPFSDSEHFLFEDHILKNSVQYFQYLEGKLSMDEARAFWNPLYEKLKIMSRRQIQTHFRFNKYSSEVIMKHKDAPITSRKRERLPTLPQKKASDSKTQDSKTQDSKTQDSKTQDSKTQDSKTQDSKTQLAPTRSNTPSQPKHHQSTRKSSSIPQSRMKSNQSKRKAIKKPRNNLRFEPDDNGFYFGDPCWVKFNNNAQFWPALVVDPRTCHKSFMKLCRRSTTLFQFFETYNFANAPLDMTRPFLENFEEFRTKGSGKRFEAAVQECMDYTKERNMKIHTNTPKIEAIDSTNDTSELKDGNAPLVSTKLPESESKDAFDGLDDSKEEAEEVKEDTHEIGVIHYGTYNRGIYGKRVLMIVEFCSVESGRDVKECQGQVVLEHMLAKSAKSYGMSCLDPIRIVVKKNCHELVVESLLDLETGTRVCVYVYGHGKGGKIKVGSEKISLCKFLSNCDCSLPQGVRCCFYLSFCDSRNTRVPKNFTSTIYGWKGEPSWELWDIEHDCEKIKEVMLS